MPDTMSRFQLIRMWYSDNSTIGKLSFDGVFQCFTLERTIRQGHGIMAIPEGRYRLTLYHSPHFDRMMPLLMNVPGRDFIEIHCGNYSTDSEGCILVGAEKGTDDVLESRLAFNALFPKIEKAILSGPTYICIANGSATALA